MLTTAILWLSVSLPAAEPGSGRGRGGRGHVQAAEQRRGAALVLWGAAARAAGRCRLRQRDGDGRGRAARCRTRGGGCSAATSGAGSSSASPRDSAIASPARWWAWADGRLALSVNPSTEPPGTQYGRCDPHLLLFDTRKLDEPPDDAPAAVAEGGAFHRPLVSRHRRRRGPGRGPRPEHRRHHERPALGVRLGRRRLLPHRRDRLPDPGVLSPGGAPRPGGPRHGDRRHRRAERDLAGLQEAEDRPRLGLRLPPPLLHHVRPTSRRTDFAPPVEIDTVEATGGHITNLDLWVDPDGTAHLLYLKTDLTPALRDEFFPGRPIVTTLEHVEIAGGKVSRRTTLAPAARRPARPRTTPASTSPRTAPSGSSSSSPAAGPTAPPSSRTASSRSAPAGKRPRPCPSPSRRRFPPSSPPPSAAAAGRRTCWISSASAETERRCGMRGCG